MPITDPIADYLVRIKNAVKAYKDIVIVPASQIKLEITKILKEEGFIENFKYEEDGKQGLIKIYLKYGSSKEQVIRGMKRVSKPGRRVYCKSTEIPLVQQGLGICILSTSKGILTGNQAKRLRVGGEVLCYVW